MEFGIEVFFWLAAAALVAGCVDAIAGGGGLITVPAMLLAGFDPATAVATNKLQSTFGSGSATLAFARAGRIDWRRALPFAASGAAASVLGALCVQRLSNDVLLGVVPFLLAGAALYFGLSPSLSDANARRRISPAAFGLLFVPVVGFYDGFFGPGTGSFYMAGGVALLGLAVVPATAQTKLLNFASNAAALAFFIGNDAVVWPIGLSMGLFAWTGAQIGSRLAMRHGARLIRPALVVMCCLAALRLLLDGANPIRHFVEGLF
jgi:uncharacterized membrane protein YfcA